MDQKNREMYSLETELKLLRPFVQKSPTYKRRYSEEDLLAAEQGLTYKLPAPLRFMYLIFYEEVDEFIAKIEKRFRPLSEHTELLVGDIPQLYTAYIHLQEPILIVVLPGFLDLILLTPNEIAPDVRADLEQSTGLTFRPVYPS